MFIILLGFIIIITLLNDNIQIMFNNNNELINTEFNDIWKENFNTINKLYNYPTNLITLLLINYLFFTLIVVVKITNFYYGPLRNLN